MNEKSPFKTYYVSGVWINAEGSVSDYCIHQYSDLGISGMKKVTKEQLFGLLTKHGIVVYVLNWNYNKGCFVHGQEVKLIQGVTINTVPPAEEHQELKHLIRLDWFYPMESF